VIGEVTLSSGQTAQYYVDAKRALLRPQAFRAAGALIAAEAAERGASAVGGMTMGADPLRLRCDRIGGRRRPDRLLRPQGAKAARPPALDRGSRARAGHPLPRRRGRGHHRRLDGSGAIERILEEGFEVAGVTSVVDRLAGGAEAIEAAGGRPYRPLVTIDELYPERPDR